MLTNDTIDPALLPQLAWFALIARHGSFTKAAAAMGVSRPAMSQNLKMLERKLGVKLLYRTTRDMALTEDGQRLLHTIGPALSTIGHGVRTLTEATSEPSGLLRVNTSHIAARLLLEPHLGEFLGCYPKLQLELVIDDGLANIIADGCDAGIRLGRSLAEGVVAVPLTPKLAMAVVGTPGYFKQHGKPKTPEDLARHNCIRYRFTTSGAIDGWEFTSPKGDAFEVHPQGSYTTSDDRDYLQAALQGIGLVQHIDLAVNPYLRDGALVRVLKGWCKPFSGFHLYVPSRDMPSKVRALMDFLMKQRGQLAALNESVHTSKQQPPPRTSRHA